MGLQSISILGCGWLGLPLGETLRKKGLRVHGATTTPEKLDRLAEAGIEPYHIVFDPDARGENLRAFFDAEALFLNIPPRRGGGEAAARFYLDQVRAVRRELRYSPVEFVLFASSTSVYDTMNGVVIERDAGRPLPPSATGRALLDAEQMLRDDRHFDTTVLRFAGLYGYGRHPGRFLSGRHDLKNGDAPINLVHRDDCLAVITALLAEDLRGETFNVCADEHPIRRDFYPEAARRLGLEPPTFAADGPTSYKIVSNDKLKQRLGYQFLHPDPATDAP